MLLALVRCNAALDGAPADVDEWLAGCPERRHTRPGIGQNHAQLGIGGIPARQPQDLRRRSQLHEQADEVRVLRQQHGTCVSRSGKVDAILGVAQTTRAEWYRFNSEGGVQPRGQRGREMRVDPDEYMGPSGRYAATTG